MSTDSLRYDRRAVTPALSHVLTISMTAILLMGLLMAGGGFLENQEEATVHEELDTIGNRLASELSRVDTLGQYGGDATIRTRHPAEISGGGYSVDLVSVDECDVVSGPNASCLVLESHGFDVVEEIPVRNETAVSLTVVSSGTYELSGTPQSSASVGGREELTARGDLSEYVGIADDIQEDPLDTRLEQRNFPPNPRFEVRPYPPTTGEAVTLDANASSDPDGNITEFKWDVGNDGTWDYEGEDQENVSHWFDKPGRHEVRLQVTDDHRTPANASITRNVSVSGLEYQNDLSTADSDGSVEFTMKNNWSEPVRLSEVFVNPDDDNINEINQDWYGWGSNDREVRIDVDADRDVDVWVNYEYGREIHDSGVILDVDQKPGPDDDINGVPAVQPGDSARIELYGFRDGSGDTDMEGEDIEIGVTYVAESTGMETLFGDTVNGGS